jgi:phosphoribosylformylglycinamidine synthase PurS subunit
MVSAASTRRRALRGTARRRLIALADLDDSTLSHPSIFIALPGAVCAAGLNSAGMARVVVDVMPKPEILDPQGKAVTGALARLGFAGVSVRQGKRFELDVDGELTEDRLAEVRRAAETLLANTVIETFNVRVEELPAPPDEEDQGEPVEQAELATQAG